MVRKVLIFLISLITLSIPQQLSAGWTRTYGTEAWEYGSSIHQTPDGGYIVGGYKENVSGGEGDLWLLKTNPSGDTSWTRAYGGEGDDYGTYVEMTSDGGYILAGECESWDYGGWLIKTDAVGDTQWTYSQGGWSGFSSVRETSDGGYIAVGYEEGASFEDVLLVKLDANGLVKWIKAHGGVDMDWGACVEQTADGGYIVSASTYSFGAGESDCDLWLLKTDENGDTLWTRLYGGANYDFAGSVQPTPDGGYLVMTFTDSFDPDYYYFRILKVDSNGDTVWTRMYGGEEGSDGYSVRPTSDGNYIIAAQIDYAGTSDAWILKMDGNGDTLWTRSYGGDSWDHLYWGEQTSDGGYIFVGETYSFGADDGDLWIIKTDSLGDTLGSFVVEKPITETPIYWQIVKSVGRQIVLRYRDCPQGFNASVFDASGRKVDEIYSNLTFGTITWGEGAEPGVYFISPAGSRAKGAKVVILR